MEPMDSERFDVDALTPDDHVAELTKLAEHYEQAAKHFIRTGATRRPKSILWQYERRAAAIRWILAETAHDASEAVG